MKVIKRIKQILCHHWWMTELILGSPPHTHHDKRRCIKCDKRETTFSGPRWDWYRHHGFPIPGEKQEAKP